MHICHFYICIPCNRFCLWLHIQDITADSNKKISVDKKASAIKENAPPAVTNAASVVENENISIVVDEKATTEKKKSLTNRMNSLFREIKGKKQIKLVFFR